MAQDSSNHISGWSVNGYLSALESIQFDRINHSNSSGHLLHNRINIKWNPDPHIGFVGEIRNRFFYGEAGSENQHPVLKSEIERLYSDLQFKKWNLRIGRQRVNWGMATIWNPNDIFNAYNFLDVDDEERPGADAIRLQYHLNDFSHVAFVHSGLDQQQISAVQYFINTHGYDFQGIAGNYKGNPTIGVGWAGSLNAAGFKGEVQYYYNSSDSLKQLNLTLGIDYMFKKGWYLNTGILFNSTGLDQHIQTNQYLNLQLSAKNLMPTKYNLMWMIQKQISPLSSFSLTGIYAPKADLMIWMPAFRYNIAANFDADLIWQSFYMSRNDRMQGLSEMGFFRLRWNF